MAVRNSLSDRSGVGGVGTCGGEIRWSSKEEGCRCPLLAAQDLFSQATADLGKEISPQHTG